MEPFTVSASSTRAICSGRSPSTVRQLRPAENISITLQSQRPKAFVFRDKRYIVERTYGPWLTGGEWWTPTLWGLEQWDLVAHAQDNTLLLCCLVRDLMQDRWQMTALYD
jgi:protein ImuB